MTLNSYSRYTTDIDSVTSDIIAVRKTLGTEQYSTYVSRSGDTFDLLATRVYSDPSQYWRIADLNPHIKFPNEIPTGTVIRLPA